MAIDPNNLAGTAHLTFDDEFNSLSLWNGTSGTWDTNAAWADLNTNGYSLNSNGEQEWYINNNYAPTASVKPWTVSGGKLNLTAAPASASIQPLINNYKYTSGQVNTSKSFSQEYGYFEVNAKLPAGQGFWPAFWLLPENNAWPPELDAMENLGNNTSTYYTTVHYNANNQYNTQSVAAGVDLSAGYHTYGVDWEPDKITWYLDGKQVFQAATPADMHTPMYMILNLALGGSWPGDVNSSTKLPGAMQVDWVRAYAAGPSSTSSAGSTSTSSTGATTKPSGSTSSGSTSSGSTSTGSTGATTKPSGSTSSGSTSTGSTSTGSTGATTKPSGSTSSSSTSTSSTSTSSSSSAGHTLKAPSDNPVALTGGAGNDTLIATHGADTLTGGAGSDTFEFSVIPWSAGQVRDFTPGVDKLDVAPLLQAAHYHGSNPVADGWLTFSSDGKGDTQVFLNPHDGTNSGYPYLITTLDHVAPSAIVESRDVIFGASSSSTSTSTSTGAATTTSGASSVSSTSTGSGSTAAKPPATSTSSTSSTGSSSSTTSTATATPGHTLKAPNDNPAVLTGGAGHDILIATHGADTLTGGAGSDTFEFSAIPWSAGHVRDFTPGVDKLDLAPLFQTAHYHGTNPVADGWLTFSSDGKGDTQVFFNPHDGSNSGYPYLITTLDHVAPSSIVASRDVIFGTSGSTSSTSTTTSSSTTTTSTTTATPGHTLKAASDNPVALTGGAGNDTLIATHGADTLTGGAGSDTFEFSAIPWSAGHVRDFTPGVDKLDLAPIFQAAHYHGSNPVADGWLSFSSDGKGDTQVFFNPHDGTNHGYPYLITTLDHVAPTSLVQNHDLIFS